jgi:hypothetical protein
MNKKLALVEEKEIAEIKRKHLSIYDAARQSLSTAIEIGQWFNEKHKEIEHGGWLKWLRENFAEISDDSVRNYIRLAQNRKLLEANLQIPNARNLEWPSIREALRQIDSLKKGGARQGRKGHEAAQGCMRRTDRSRSGSG